MPFSYVQYQGPGAGPWVFSKPFLLRAHVKLYFDLDLVTGTYTKLLADTVDYIWSSSTQITATVPAGTTLTIRRETPISAQMVTFTGGSNLTSSDLNTSDQQLLFSLQEQADRQALVVPPAPGPTAYIHTQSTPSGSWVINHNLGYKPSVELLDAGSQEIEGDVSHPSQNQVAVGLSPPTAGIARLV